MLSPGLRVTRGVATGFVFLATATCVAAPAHADSSDPLTPPEGWSGQSVSGHWDYGQNSVLAWNLLDQHGQPVDAYDPRLTQDESVRPEDSLFVDIFHSGDAVKKVGDTNEFLLHFRRAPAPFNPFPTVFPGAYLDEVAYHGTISFSVDLRDLIDNVGDLGVEDVVVEGAQPENLSISGGVLSGAVRFKDGESLTSLRLRTSYTGQGNDTMSLTAQAQQHFRYYGATVEAGVRIPIEAPTFEVFKTADTGSVAEAGDEITYSVTVHRLREGGPRAFTLTDDMSDVLKDATGFTASELRLPEGLSGTPTVDGTGFSLSAEWPNDPESGEPVDSLNFGYTVAYDGASEDTELVNVACVSVAGAQTAQDCAEAAVAVGTAQPPSSTGGGESPSTPAVPTTSTSPGTTPGATSTPGERPTEEPTKEPGDGTSRPATPTSDTNGPTTPGREPDGEHVDPTDGAPFTSGDPTAAPGEELSTTGANVPAAAVWGTGALLAAGAALVAGARRGRVGRRHS